MRKGVVLEHKHRSTIIMTKQGEFIRAKKVTGAVVGEEVMFEPKTAPSLRMFTHKRISIVAVAIIMIFSLFPAYFWEGNNRVYASVSIDINPSIEAKVNREMEVISIRSLNDDGEALLEELPGFEGKKFTAFASEVFRLVEKEGLVSNGKNALIGVSYLKDQEKTDVSKEIRGFFDKEEESFKIATYTVPYEWMEEAEKKGESVHKVVHHHLDQDEQLLNLDEDDRGLIRSFFQSEKEQEESDPMTEESDSTSPDEENNGSAPAPEKTVDEKAPKEDKTPVTDEPSSEEDRKNGKTSEPDSRPSDPPFKKEKENKNSPAKDEKLPATNGNGHGPPSQTEPPSSSKPEDHPGNNGESRSDAKPEDHPGNNGESRSGAKPEDHPGNNGESRSGAKSEDHPGNNGESRSGAKPENHPSNKGKDHPSNKNKSNGNGPPNQ
ncbi:anti-sigma factor domain-containing protein [Salimicrobium sp. PL1-032A]|uniref:anti-sigma-I factor RsgI family protein n=1 Tax=Salimicrobium sp. PL1-032A TaxID=3095364 RepID=UPI0032618F98